MTQPNPYTASRIVSAATAAYAVFAAVKPRHLAKGLQAPDRHAPALDRVAYTYTGRDLSISALAFTGSPLAVRASMIMRIVGDITDATVLGTYAPTTQARRKVVSVTLGWGVITALALAWDERRGE